MKKASLLICMLAVTLMSSAQFVNRQHLTATPTKGKAVSTTVTSRQLASDVVGLVKADATWKSNLVNGAPRLAKADGVFYNRPSGSYTCGWTKDWGGWSADILFGVPLGKNIFENACDNPMEATWTMVTSSTVYDLEGEEETNNLSYDGFAYDAESDTYDNGFNMFYLPTINVGDDSFTWGETNTNGAGFAIAGRPSPFTKAPMTAAYGGWANAGSIYGTGSNIDFDFEDDGVDDHYILNGIWQIHEAPQSSMYVEDIYVLGRLGSTDEDPDTDIPAYIPEGEALHLLVTTVSDDGWPTNDVIADLTCSADDIIPIESNGNVVAYSYVFSKKEVDVLGMESVVPFTINQRYAIVLDWELEGAQVNFAGNNYDPDADDIYAPKASMMILTDENGNKSLTTLRYTSVTVTPVFDAMFDYAEVYDVLYDNQGNEYPDMNLLTAPVAGGKIWEQEDENINVMAYCATAFPWFDETEAENYYFSEFPDWITDYAVQEDTNGDDASGFTFVSFEVEPLPADVAGRRAKIYIQGRGFTTETPIIVVQGEDPGEELPVKEITDGKYILVNVATGKCWGEGNDWGTRASLVENPEYLTLLKQPDGTYFLETQVNNGGEQIYFNGDYMDNGSPMALTITRYEEEPIGEGMDDQPVWGYTIADNAGQYYGFDGTSTVLGKNINITTEEGLLNALWLVVSEEEMMANLQYATAEDPINVTFLISDPNFGRNNRYYGDWTFEASNKNNAGDNTNFCVESYHSEFTMSQTLEGVPNGVYKLTAQGFYRQDGEDNENLPVFFINDATTTFPLKTGNENSMANASVSFKSGLYTCEPIYVKVENGTITLGAKLEGNTALWCIWDNFVLTYYGPDATIEEAKAAALLEDLYDLQDKAEELLDQVDNDAVKAALQEALDASQSIDASSGEAAVKAAVEKLADAVDKAEGNIIAQNVLPAMKELVDATNVYTEEALNAYYTVPAEKYAAGTLTKVEASALQNPNDVTGWHAAITVDDFLLSAWDTNPDFNNAPYYINSWSTEGDNDGTNFHVPFFEYWTGDGESLAERTLTATMNNVPEGNYDVTVWARVRAKNGYEAPAYGIGLQVNDGAEVNVAAGQQVGESQFYLDTFKASGVVGADGVLKIKFNVAADNNISWLSFKNVMFEKGAAVDDPELVAPAGWTSVIVNGNLASDNVQNYFSKEYPAPDPSPSTIIAGAGKNGSRGIVVKTQDKVSQAWDSQFFIRFNDKLADGTQLHVEFDYKADNGGSVSTQSHAEPGAYLHWAAIGNVNFTPEWQHYSADVTVEGAMADMQSIAFNLNDVATADNYYFDNFGIWVKAPEPVDEWVDLLINGSMEGTEVANFFSKEAPSAEVLPSRIFDGMGVDGSRGIKVESAAGASQDWDTQFWIYLPTTLPAGTKYKVEFDYRSDINASADTQSHAAPGSYIYWSMIGSPNFTPEWQHYEKAGTVSADQASNADGLQFQSIAFNLSKDKANDVKFFFDNIKFFVEKDWYETGIRNLNAEQQNGGAFYNLRGQRVESLQKGVYIINGKKVVVK